MATRQGAMPAPQDQSRHAEVDANTHDKAKWNGDVWLLLTARFVRMLAFGSSSLVLALFLSDLGQTPVQVGRFLTLTLVGDFFLSLVLTFVADSIGRRNTLRYGALSMLVAGLVFATTDNVHLLLLAAIFGVISPSGNEIGPFRAVEESILADLVDEQHRPSLFGWYVVTGSVAASLATWLGGLLNKTVDDGSSSRDGLLAYSRWVFVVYSILGLVKLLLTLALSSRCERPVLDPSADRNADEREPLLPNPNANPPALLASSSSTSFPVGRFTTLCLLFAVDSFGSGMVTQTLQSWFLSRKFNAPLSSLGTILSAALLVSSFTNLFTARLAKQLGLVLTMVLTHLPSNIFLALTPLPNSLAWTSALIVARASTSSMDNAPRSAFMAKFVPAQHRTKMFGMVNTVKALAQSGGPVLTGWFTSQDRMGWAFVVAGALKAGYDLGC